MADEELGGSQAAPARANDNRRETGAQTDRPHPESDERAAQLRNASHADEKRKPGLATPVDEVEDATHQSDGVDGDTLKR